MRHAHVVSFPIVLIGGVCSAQVAVTVNISEAGGAPIGNVPIGAWPAGGEPVGMTTDGTGNATAQMQLDPSDTGLLFKIVPWHMNQAPIEEQIEVTYRAYDLYSQYRVERIYALPVQPGSTQLQMQINLKPAIKVTGVLVDGTGAPLKGGALHSGLMDPRRDPGAQGFSIGGVPRNETSVIYLGTGGYYFKRQIVPSSPVDIDLGNIQLDVPLNTTPVRITIPAFEPTPVTQREIAAIGVTLIAVDGSYALSYWGRPDTTGYKIVDNPATEGLPLLPAGEFYVIPSPFGATRLQLNLWDAVLTGANIPPEVPRVTAVGTAEISLSVDAVAVLEAIEQMP